MKPSPKFALKSLAIALGAVLLGLPTAGVAGEPGPGEHRERLQQGADRMAEELGLNDDQRTKIQGLAQQERSEMDALRANTALSKEEKMTQKKAIREKYQAQRHAILTPEQQAKAEKMRGKFEKHRERLGRGERGEGKERGQRGEKPAN